MNRAAARCASPLLLTGILALAVLVRVAGIDARISVDEAYSWLVASSPNASVFLHRLAASENTPPLFYLALSLAPGRSPAALRVPAAVAGVLMCLAVYLICLRLLGRRVAVPAALAVAVAPYLVTYSDLARAFTLADVALLGALGALLALGERETPLRWGVFWLAGTVAVYSEYASAIALGAMLVMALLTGMPSRRHSVLAGASIAVTLLPWVPQIADGQDQLGLTKLNPMGAAPSLTGLRDALLSLAFGENGGTANQTGRWLLFFLLLGLAAGVATMLWRTWERRAPREHRVALILGGTLLLSLLGHAVAALVGLDVFNQRYMTILIPLAATLAVMAIAGRRSLIALSVLLVALGAVNGVRRVGAQYQPDFSPVARRVALLRPRTVLTNTPEVLYYLPGLHPILDRPFNLGAGDQASCTRPCLIIDDTDVSGGTPRPVQGERATIGPYLLVLEER